MPHRTTKNRRTRIEQLTQIAKKLTLFFGLAAALILLAYGLSYQISFQRHLASMHPPQSKNKSQSEPTKEAPDSK